MVVTLPMKTVSLKGANRGGREATEALLRYPNLPKLAVDLVDKTPGRASLLSRRWEEAGHRASALTADAGDLVANLVPNTSRKIESTSSGITTGTAGTCADLDLLCTDDPTIQLRLLETSGARLALAGLLLASDDTLAAGGRVLGFGAVVPEADPNTRADATRLYETLARITGGERVTSRMVNAPPLNIPQVEIVRRVLYQEMARQAHQFLTAGISEGRLLVAAAWPSAQVYFLHLEERNSRSRSQLRDRVQELGQGQALACTDMARPDWLYVALKSPDRQTVTVELPVSAVKMAPLPRRASAGSHARVYATD